METALWESKIFLKQSWYAGLIVTLYSQKLYTYICMYVCIYVVKCDVLITFLKYLYLYIVFIYHNPFV